jgi:disulfide bond formation protein DsbB
MNTLLMSRFFALLTIVADLVVIVSVLLFMTARRRTTRSSSLAEDIKALIAQHGLWLASAIAITCTLGSLYLSEVANFVPCRLCWYQRYAMYPLAVILPILAFKDARKAARWTVLLAGLGASISVYHYLIERFPDLASSASCDVTAPCTVVWIWQFHFISIPFMALSGFLAIICLVLAATASKEEES